MCRLMRRRLAKPQKETIVDHETRRSFAKKTGAALAVSPFLNLNPRALGANEKVVLALIGGRNQGRGDALRAISQGAEIKTFCDIDQAILDKVNPDLAKAQQRAPGTVKDFRRVLDDKDIDGVIIAVPDHSHAYITLLACQARKDVYIEKPLSHTIHEGHLMREAARKYNRIVQVGTQNRSAAHYRDAVEYVASGKLGKICMINAWECQVRPSIGNPPDSDPRPPWITTCGLVRHPSGPSTRIGFTTTGASSGTTAIRNWATKAYI